MKISKQIYFLLIFSTFLSSCSNEIDHSNEFDSILKSGKVPGIIYEYKTKVLAKEKLPSPETKRKQIHQKIFYFNKDSLAIVNEKRRNQTFSLIKSKKDSIFFYWTNKKGRFYRNRQVYSNPLLNDSLRTVEIDTIKKNTKLYGFDCSKVKVTIKNNRPFFKGRDVETFEVYLTNEIKNFPPHLLFAGQIMFETYFPKLEGCALKIVYRNKAAQYRQTISVIELIQGDSTIFEVPDSLKSAVRFYNTLHGGEDRNGMHVWMDSLECHGIY